MLWSFYPLPALFQAVAAQGMSGGWVGGPGGWGGPSVPMGPSRKLAIHSIISPLQQCLLAEVVLGFEHAGLSAPSLHHITSSALVDWLAWF